MQRNNSLTEENTVLIADPKVLSVSIYENNEPLIDLSYQKEITYGPAPLAPNNTSYTKIRKTIYAKLVEAQAMLPDGLKFCIYEGYRSLDLQQKIFQERYNSLHKENPKMTHEQLFTESTKFVSPVINLDGSINIPPHSTGAAIDIYLIDRNRKVVDMGILLDDTYNDLDGTFCKTNSQVISEKAQEYRKMMGKSLEAVGFVNYPTEYWHWSYGDRYWAYQTHQKYAIYTSVPTQFQSYQSDLLDQKPEATTPVVSEPLDKHMTILNSLGGGTTAKLPFPISLISEIKTEHSHELAKPMNLENSTEQLGVKAPMQPKHRSF